MISMGFKGSSYIQEGLVFKETCIRINKLDNIIPQVGYPDMLTRSEEIDQYHSELYVLPSDGYFEIMRRILQSDLRRRLSKLLKAPDRAFYDEISHAVVNAFYVFQSNSVVIPAGILQPPLFKIDYPNAINYGAIGFHMGHELTHVFDDQGRQYDQNGNVDEWWSEKSLASFLNRTSCIIRQFDNYELAPKLNVNGHMTVGENIADTGGIEAAFKAYKAATTGSVESQQCMPYVNMTMDQAFFMSFATSWCINDQWEHALNSLFGDQHSPAQFRVIGSLSNLDEFSEAFSCKSGVAPMNPKPSKSTKCALW